MKKYSNRQIWFLQDALQRLQAAIARGASVYIYGATGFGKTSLMERALDRAAAVWISGSDTEDHVMEQMEGCDGAQYIVLDDLHCMESAMLQRRIAQMIGREGFRMVMAGRAAVPVWISALTLQTEIVIIAEDDLRVTEGDLAAQAITGDDDADLLLRRARQAGNILVCSDGEWRIRPVLLETLRQRAMILFGQRRYNQLMYNAGRYHELRGHTIKALMIYRQCGEADGILSLLVREARKHAGVGNYWALREYYQALPDDAIQREPVLMTAMSVLYSVLMNAEASEYWYARLQEYALHAKGNDRSEANAQIAYLDIVLPHRGSKDLVRILKTVSTLLRSSGDILRPVSLTNNQPSLMNGGKDFCEWSKNDLLLAKTLGPVVERMLGRAGVGLVQTALGESAYEKGEDRFAVLSHLTRAQNQSENNGILEMTWVAIALQAKLALGTGDVEYAHRTYIHLECRVLCAVIMRRTGKAWKAYFVQTLKEIGEYHFVPIFSERGAAVLPLLMEVKAMLHESAPQLDAWFAQVLQESTHMARLYPNFLKGMGVDISAFSETAHQVLRLQAAGYTAREIADQLHITQRTVKYHASENYRKLDAKNLIDAVQIAQTLHIL